MYKQTVLRKTCPACNGAKVQVNKDGLKVLCPACRGKGYLYEPNDVPFYISATAKGQSSGTGKDDYVVSNIEYK